MYREDYQLASNYADRVLMFKKSTFLDLADRSLLKLGFYAYVPEVSEWFRLSGFRKAGTENEVSQYLELALIEWTRKASAMGYASTFVLSKKSGELRLLYGSGASAADVSFRAHIPEVSLSDYYFGEEEYRYSGLITGSVKAHGLADMYASSHIDYSYVALVNVPVGDIEIEAKLFENRDLLALLDNHKSIQRVYGNATRRIEDISLHNIVRAMSLLREENEYLEQYKGSGFVRAAVRFGANSNSDYHSLKSLILSSLNAGEGGYHEPPRVFDFHEPIRNVRDMLAIPYVDLGKGSSGARIYTLTLQDVKSTSSFCLPPLESYVGFYIKNYDIGPRDRDAFPAIGGRNSSGISIGTVAKTRERALIPFSSLHSHAFVTGATETGKTTTLKRMLVELYRSGLSFTVIEAAKKEYISLLAYVPELRVYTPGNDGEMLAMNPLEPEDGILIENHVAAVVRAMVSAMGGEHPIPEALEGLLRQSYLGSGWNYGQMAYQDEAKPFPTLRRLFENIDRYVEEQADYGAEVKQNLRAALKIRVQNICSGAMGRMFDRERGLKAKDILEHPSVIELADFSLKSAEFLMNMLLFKFQSYLSKLPESPELNRVIVVEEAHNIFGKNSNENGTRAINNEYFDKMLSEIRTSGTGLILSDQRPSSMSDAVMANTSVKLLHTIVEAEDWRRVGDACSLSDFQQKKLGELKKGECLLSLRGHYGIQSLSVEALNEEGDYNSACHVCSSRFRCKKEEARRLMLAMDPSLLSYYISKIKSHTYNAEMLVENIELMFHAFSIQASAAVKLCLLAEILDAHGLSSMQEKRIISNSYSKFLNRGPSYE